jgi:acyl-CoA oxidase
MKAESDTVQATAMAYAEREVLEACLRTLQQVPSLAAILKPVVTLFALSRLEADLGWLLTEGVLPVPVGRIIPDRIRALCKELAPSSQRLVNCFGIPDHLIAAPIASDWVKYNVVDNQGELFNAAWA